MLHHIRSKAGRPAADGPALTGDNPKKGLVEHMKHDQDHGTEDFHNDSPAAGLSELRMEWGRSHPRQASVSALASTSVQSRRGAHQGSGPCC